MRNLASPCLFVALLLVPAVDCLAATQSIFSFRDSDGWLVEVIPPGAQTGSSTTINKTFIGDVWQPFGSARDDSGKILSLTAAGAEVFLAAFAPFTRTVDVLCEFNQPLMSNSDLTFGPSGDLLWAQSGPSGTTLYAVDIQTCELTEWGSFPVNHLDTIEFHQGAFYCSGSGADLFDVDPVTFEVTVVLPDNYFCGAYGLSSDGDTLYLGWGCGGGPLFTTIHSVGPIDPQTGGAIWSIPIPNDEFQERYSLLEVVDQPIRPIPVLHQTSAVLFVVLIAFAGILVARQR
jgi:hypothetical protein